MRPFVLKEKYKKTRQRYSVVSAKVFDRTGSSVEINFNGNNIFDISRRDLKSEILKSCNSRYPKRDFFEVCLKTEPIVERFTKRTVELTKKIAFRYCSLEFFAKDAIRLPLYYTNKEIERMDNWRDKNIHYFESSPLFRKEKWDDVDLRNIEIAGILASWVNIQGCKGIYNKCIELQSYIGDNPIRFIMGEEYTLLDVDQHACFFDEYTYGDLLHLFGRLRSLYDKYPNLENAVIRKSKISKMDLTDSLISLFEGCEGFRLVNSTRRRINIFLRWMVQGWKVDLGVWSRINTKVLKPAVSVLDYQEASKLRLVGKRVEKDYPDKVTEAARYLFPDCPAFLDYAIIGHRTMLMPGSKYGITKMKNVPNKDIQRTLRRVTKSGSAGLKYKYEIY